MWSSLELPVQLSLKRSWRLAPIHGEFVQTDTSLRFLVAQRGCKKDCVNVVLMENEGERDETRPKQF